MRIGAAFACSMVMAGWLALPAHAQALGNRAGGREYEPNPAEVQQREKQVGIAPGKALYQREDEELERIDRELLREEGVGTNGVPGGGRRPPR